MANRMLSEINISYRLIYSSTAATAQTPSVYGWLIGLAGISGV